MKEVVFGRILTLCHLIHIVRSPYFPAIVFQSLKIPDPFHRETTPSGREENPQV